MLAQNIDPATYRQQQEQTKQDELNNTYIDEKNRIWTIPAEQMKRGIEHRITLSRQTLALLEQIKKLSGGKTYLFPSVKSPQSHVNTQTANAAIKRVKAAYDRGERLKQRFQLLQTWADFVEQSVQGALPQFHLKIVA
nr:tyrosine-type recombinase/integrase [Aggregatibacter actinomycetemcomitans]